MSRLEAMSAFAAVCDAGGFAPAARRLGLSSSVVSRHVTALEVRLGVQLLARTTRALSLTEAGRRYLEHVRQVLASVDEADRAVQQNISVPRGRLIVTAPQVLGRTHVAKLVCRYMASNPEIVADLRLHDRLVNLVEEGVDVAIRIGPLADSSLVAKRLGETRRIVVGSPTYLRTFGRPSHPDDLPRHHTAFFSTGSAPPEWRFQVAGREHRVRLTPRFVTNSADAMVGHVIDGGGLAQVSGYMAFEAVQSDLLEIVMEEFEPPPAPISALYAPSRLLSAKVRSFVDFVAAEANWKFLEPRQNASTANVIGLCAPSHRYIRPTLLDGEPDAACRARRGERR